MSNIYALTTNSLRQIDEMQNLIHEKCEYQFNDDRRLYTECISVKVSKMKRSFREDIYQETFGFDSTIEILIRYMNSKYEQSIRDIVRCTMCVLENDSCDAVLTQTDGGICLTRINGELSVHDWVNGRQGRLYAIAKRFREGNANYQRIFLSEVTLPYKLVDIDIPGWE